MHVQVARAAAAPVQHSRARAAFELQVLDHGLDGCKPGARGQKHDGFGAFFTQIKAAKRAFDAQDFFFLHGAEHVVGELAAGGVANMQLNARGFGLGVRRIAHGIGAAVTVTQQNLDILARVVLEHVAGRKLQAHQHHVIRRLSQAADA